MLSESMNTGRKTYLFAHMSSAVGSEKGTGCGELAYDTGRSNRAPAAVVREARSTEHLASRNFGCKYPQRYHDGKESNDMESQNEPFEYR